MTYQMASRSISSTSFEENARLIESLDRFPWSPSVLPSSATLSRLERLGVIKEQLETIELGRSGEPRNITRSRELALAGASATGEWSAINRNLCSTAECRLREEEASLTKHTSFSEREKAFTESLGDVLSRPESSCLRLYLAALHHNQNILYKALQKQ